VSSHLGINQTLLPWLLAGEIDLVLDELQVGAYFDRDERDKIKVLMARVNNHEQMVALRKDRENGTVQ